MIKAIIKNPNNGLKVVELDGSLKQYQKIVGGCIDIPYISELLNELDIDCIINDEGKLLNMPYNFGIYSPSTGEVADYIAGSVIFTSCNKEGETVSLNAKQIEILRTLFDTAPNVYYTHTDINGKNEQTIGVPLIPFSL